MDIKEFQDRRAKLELDLSVATEKLISDFENETKAQVTNISTDIYQVGGMGEPTRSIVGKTSVDLHI